MSDNPLLTYLPQDRLAALASGQDLPDRALGAVLSADISGFTSLTEQLTQQLGARRGIEGLTRRINAVYNVLISAIERYGGSVIGFAGDAMTCWFNDSEASPEGMVPDGQLALRSSSARAVTAALALQSAMCAFPELGLKVAVASGPVRRLVVGDPAIQLLDTLAGATLTRMAAAEDLASRGEVVADEVTVAALGETGAISAWRTAGEERFGVVHTLSRLSQPAPLAPLMQALTLEYLRPWVLDAVYVREQGSLDELLTELRPAVPLFMSFSGLDYDADEAVGGKLDAVIRRVQAVVRRYEGALLQLTIGDKGNYVYANFGALVAHEDDARRALLAALALQTLGQEFAFLQALRIGVASGTLRVGAYGGVTRRTYGALGDDVNLAARLMTKARPGEILVSGRVHNAVAETFGFEPRPPLAMKGKAEPLPVFAVTGRQGHRATRLREPTYHLPMVGRQEELALISERLKLAGQGQGQVIGITAEAGMGKSRLAAEAIRLAQGQGFGCYGGACESAGTNTAYLVWKPIWQAFFDIDPAASLRRQLRNLEGEIADRAPDRLPALPVLGTLLDLPLEDNDFTRALEPKDRRNVLIATLEACLKAATQEEPILFVLEDVHWIDPLSHDLVETLARVSANLRVCFILAYRQFELARLQAPRVEALPHFSKLTLQELTPEDAGQLMRAKLAQLYPERAPDLPAGLVEQLTAKAQGNPFYLEELLNYLHDRGIAPDDAQAVGALALPNSLHTLVLSRMDQLTESQKATLKVASIIGRLFPFAWLHGYYPALGVPDAVKADLNELARLELTLVDTPEPELAYLFKHIVTQEAAYESLAYATRAQLHELLAQYLETQAAAAGWSSLLDALAFHYSRSENRPKQREYLRKAGEAAQAAYANAAALDYYERLLPLLEGPGEQVDIRLKLAEVLELLGRWDEAEAHCRQALPQATEDAARCQFALGRLSWLRGEFAGARRFLEESLRLAQAASDREGIANALNDLGQVAYFQGDGATARALHEECLALSREMANKWSMATTLKNLGNVAYMEGNLAKARALYEESLALGHEINDKRHIADALSSLGSVALYHGSSAEARAYWEQSLALRAEMGDKRGISIALGHLGMVAGYDGDSAEERARLEESLALDREMGDTQGIEHSLGCLGESAYFQGDYAAAQAYLEQSLELARAIGDKRGVADVLKSLGDVALQKGDYETSQACWEQSLALDREMGENRGISLSLSNLGNLALHQGDCTAARALCEEGLALSREMGNKQVISISLSMLANAAYFQGEYAEALALHVEGLALRREVGDNLGMVWSLLCLAGVTAGLGGNMADAAQLVGAAEAARATIGCIVESTERRVCERAVAAARAALGEEAFAAAFAAGQQMTLDEAVAHALALKT